MTHMMFVIFAQIDVTLIQLQSTSQLTTMTTLQQLHNHCIGKHIFTEHYLASKFIGKIDAVKQGLNEFLDIFVCKDRAIVASI